AQTVELTEQLARRALPVPVSWRLLADHGLVRVAQLPSTDLTEHGDSLARSFAYLRSFAVGERDHDPRRIRIANPAERAQHVSQNLQIGHLHGFTRNRFA